MRSNKGKDKSTLTQAAQPKRQQRDERYYERIANRRRQLARLAERKAKADEKIATAIATLMEASWSCASIDGVLAALAQLADKEAKSGEKIAAATATLRELGWSRASIDEVLAITASDGEPKTL